MEGDWGNCMYIIDHGCVSVHTRGKHVTDMCEKGFFGEYSLLRNEPQSATIIAKTECYLWKLDNEEIQRNVLPQLPISLQTTLIEVADKRRGELMRLISPLDHRILYKASPLFSSWDKSTLTSFIKKSFFGRVVPQDTELLSQGNHGTCLYYLASGEVEITVKNKQGIKEYIGTVGPGEIVGEVSILYLETCSATVRTVEKCDVWVAQKQDVMSTLLDNPLWFIAAKEAVNDKRAKWTDINILLKDKELQQLSIPHKVLQIMHSKLQPRVLDASSLIIASGERHTELLIVTDGEISDQSVQGTVLGTELLINSQATWWNQSLKSRTKVEMWYLPQSEFWFILQEQSPSLFRYLIDESGGNSFLFQRRKSLNSKVTSESQMKSRKLKLNLKRISKTESVPIHAATPRARRSQQFDVELSNSTHASTPHARKSRRFNSKHDLLH